MSEADKKAEDWIQYFKVCGMGIQDLKNVQRFDGEQMLVTVLKRMKIGSALELVKACNR